MKRMIVLHRGMSMRDACSAAERLGAVIAQHGSEIRFEHQLAGRFVCSATRRDCSAALAGYLRRLYRARLAEAILDDVDVKLPERSS